MNVRKLPPDLQKKAIKELNEDPNRLEADINHLKTWLSKQPHIKARTDDQWLLTFLRGSKFSLERAKEKLDMFYTMKSVAPELLRDRDPLNPELQAILDLGIFLPLPQTNEEGEVIALYRTGCYDPAKFDQISLSKVQLMISEIMLIENDNVIVAGGNTVLDIKGGTMGHFSKVSPMLIKKIMKIYQHAFPVRIKGQFYINVPSIFEFILDIAKSFMTEKVKSRLYVSTDDKIDSKSIPISALPKEYGGNAGTIKDLTAQWKKKVESYRDYFLSEDSYGTDESKRPGAPKTDENIFGPEGSFRKLEVD